MSRSRRFTPILCGGSGPSEKVEKQSANRCLRRVVRERLKCSPEGDVLPVAREIADEWCWPKDGSIWFGPDLPAPLWRK